MTQKRKDAIKFLLKGIETGDPASAAVVNQEKYIQHNPQTHEGGEGLAALFKRISQTNPRVNIVRIFSDGDYVFGHTEYDFSTRRIGFELFRFEGDHAVEHWDNIQPREGPNSSGHSMVDGETAVCDLEQAEANRARVRAFTETVLMPGQTDKITEYVDEAAYVEHHPRFSDELIDFCNALSDGGIVIERLHRILADGNFVLAVCEGLQDGAHSAFFDLYRLANNKIVERWNTTEAVPPPSEWKNNNGKF